MDDRKQYTSKISVIVPIYNVERFLPDCLSSVLHQTYENLEIILVDDGSPDRCGELCDHAAETDSRVRVVNKENGGLSSARNAGIDIATGEYLCFLDSDDFIGPDHIRDLCRALQECGADMAVCDAFAYVPENAVPGFSSPSEQPVSFDCLSGREAIACALAGTLAVSACAKLYHAELLREIRFPVGKVYEDHAVAFDILMRSGRVVVLHTSDRSKYFYRKRAGSIMTSATSTRYRDFIEIADSSAERLAARFPDLEEAICVYQYNRYVSFLSTLLLNNADKMYPDSVPEIQRRIRDNYKKIQNKRALSLKLRINYLLMCMGNPVYQSVMRLKDLLRRLLP